MTPKAVGPAITPDQWEANLAIANFRELSAYCCTASSPLSVAWINEEDRHRAAALCLYGQPFGFTQDDIVALDDTRRYDIPLPLVIALESLMVRIAALLPPPPSV